MNKLNLSKITKNLPKNRVDVVIFNKIDSTNDEAKRVALTNEFHVIIAEKQTKGRGRQGKKWSSPDSQNIYMTFCTENDLSFGPISLITGVICKNSIEKINSKINIGLKWPNDILHENKKVGGILVEKEHFGKKIKTIIGIGINLNLKHKESWWGDLSEFNLKKHRIELIVEIINSLIKVSDHTNKDWINQWKKSCVHLNREIEIQNESSLPNKAIFKNIDKNGNAIIETDKGLEIFQSGQINIKGIY